MSGQDARTVGFACCYVPEEIIMAAGLRARRIIPKGQGSEANVRIHPNTCCYVKSMLADALAGAYADMEAVVLANSCDAMRKLHDLWNAYVKRPVSLFLDIPKKRDAGAEAFFTSECTRLASRIGNLPHGSPVTKEGLCAAISRMNELRTAWAGLFKALSGQGNGKRAADVFALMLDGSGLGPADQASRIKGLLQSPGSELRQQRGMRILVAGNILNSPVPVSLIEDAGGAIVGFDTCFGRRHYETLTEEGGRDPFEALARRYLQRPPCARMMGTLDQVRELGKAMEETAAQGVIIGAVKFCDNFTYGIPLLKDAVQAAGAACLVLENDYEWSDPEKARIKIEAFLEMH